MICPRCNGKGVLLDVIASPTWGRREMEYEPYDCDKCKGTGEVEEPCES